MTPQNTIDDMLVSLLLPAAKPRPTGHYKALEIESQHRSVFERFSTCYKNIALSLHPQILCHILCFHNPLSVRGTFAVKVDGDKTHAGAPLQAPPHSQKAHR
jgi:hypothetical protein